MVEETGHPLGVGLVIIHDDAVRSYDEAARALVEPHGGSWLEPRGPARVLRNVPPGAVGFTTAWASPTGGTRWWQVTCTELTSPGPGLRYLIDDQTGRSLSELPIDVAAPHWRLDRLEALAGMGSWVMDMGSGRVQWSGALLDLVGLPAGSAVDVDTVQAMVHADDRAAMDAAMAEGMASGEPFSFVHRMLTPHSGERVLQSYCEVAPDQHGPAAMIFGVVRDITEEHRARTELAHLADHDPLTGVANRRRVTARLAEHAADPAGATLLLIDIDHFKDVNDLHGHAVGDRVIRHIAGTLSAHLGDGALLGRIGGDEFAVVLPHCDPAAGIALGEKLCAAVAGEPVAAAGSALRLGVSIGVAAMPPGQEAETALAEADLALYEAKHAGRNQARLFTAHRHRWTVTRIGLAQRLSDALESGSLALDAQPVVDLADGRILRWELQATLCGGMPSGAGPADLLAVAERTDLARRLDRWVLDRTIAALAIPRAMAAGLDLDVTLSARSLDDDDLDRRLLARLAAHDVAPDRLGLQITETTAATSTDPATRRARRLTAAGCRFTMSDFEAGFGSFARLRRLPFTAVKITGGFIDRLDTDRVDRALVTAVVGVTRELGIRAVAGQVDRAKPVDRLRELGVHEAVGIHFGRPRPLAELLLAETQT